MVFVDNLRRTLARGYVAWLVYIGTAVQVVFEFGLQSQLPGWVVLLFLALILLGRTVKQESVSGPRRSRRSRRRHRHRKGAREFQGEHGDCG